MATKPTLNGNATASVSVDAQPVETELVIPCAAEQNIENAERLGVYRDAGPVYAATGTYGDVSVELGFTTSDGEGRQRSGIGIYLRSDHIAHRKVKAIV